MFMAAFRWLLCSDYHIKKYGNPRVDIFNLLELCSHCAFHKLQLKMFHLLNKPLWQPHNYWITDSVSGLFGFATQGPTFLPQLGIAWGFTWRICLVVSLRSQASLLVLLLWSSYSPTPHPFSTWMVWIHLNGTQCDDSAVCSHVKAESCSHLQEFDCGFAAW